MGNKLVAHSNKADLRTVAEMSQKSQNSKIIDSALISLASF